MIDIRRTTMDEAKWNGSGGGGLPNHPPYDGNGAPQVIPVIVTQRSNGSWQTSTNGKAEGTSWATVASSQRNGQNDNEMEYPSSSPLSNHAFTYDLNRSLSSALGENNNHGDDHSSGWAPGRSRSQNDLRDEVFSFEDFRSFIGHDNSAWSNYMPNSLFDDDEEGPSATQAQPPYPSMLPQQRFGAYPQQQQQQQQQQMVSSRHDMPSTAAAGNNPTISTSVASTVALSISPSPRRDNESWTPFGSFPNGSSVGDRRASWTPGPGPSISPHGEDLYSSSPIDATRRRSSSASFMSESWRVVGSSPPRSSRLPRLEDEQNNDPINGSLAIPSAFGSHRNSITLPAGLGMDYHSHGSLSQSMPEQESYLADNMFESNIAGRKYSMVETRRPSDMMPYTTSADSLLNEAELEEIDNMLLNGKPGMYSSYYGEDAEMLKPSSNGNGGSRFPSYSTVAASMSHGQDATGSAGSPMMTRRLSDAVLSGASSGAAAGNPLGHEEYYRVEFKAGRIGIFYADDFGSPPTPTATSNGKKSSAGAVRYKVGDYVLVDADRGKDLGKVVLRGGEEMLAEKGESPKPILRLALPQEIAQMHQKTADEAKALALCQSKCKLKKLPMEVVDAEYQWDRRKLTYYFVADRRIDFRELVRELFKVYKTRIWMCSVEEKYPKRNPNPAK